MKMRMVPLRRIDVRTSMPYAMASVLLGVCPQTRAQESDARFYFPDPKPVNIPLAREVHMSELPAVTAAGQVRFVPAPRAPIGEERLRLLKEHAANPSGITSEPEAAPAEPSSIKDTPKVVQAYLGEDEVSCGGYFPSDGAFAVNMLYLVQVPNSCISIRDATTGNRYSIATLNSFFGFPSTDLTGDPRAVYDQLSREADQARLIRTPTKTERLRKQPKNVLTSTPAPPAKRTPRMRDRTNQIEMALKGAEQLVCRPQRVLASGHWHSAA